MIRFFISPGVGNQFFQLVAAAHYSASLKEPVEIVIVNRYLDKKHGGVKLHEMDFVRNAIVRKGKYYETVIYFLWQRFGEYWLVRKLMSALRIFVEDPVSDGEKTILCREYLKFKWFCGYWQSLNPESIAAGVRAITDVAALERIHVRIGGCADNRIHVRAGDYNKSSLFQLLSPAYYTNAISRVGEPFDVWEITTDDPGDSRVTAIVRSLRERGVQVSCAEPCSVTADFLTLIFSKKLVCANSTFSLAAAYIAIAYHKGGNTVCLPIGWYRSGREGPRSIGSWFRFEID